ncbi:MAG: response regulator [Negativicutes bacterium]|nr:response regulator [Negativicutes bacterium]MDR3589889.1 response regulator [Negativicutes bacterium]
MARILICDDSSFMRMMLKRILTGKGHEVVGEAGNGNQALALYKELKPDVTTMDITMPELDGLGALKLIRAEDKTAKVVMVSAIGQKEIMTEAIRSGASDFLVKPFEEEQVIMVVNKILRL